MRKITYLLSLFLMMMGTAMAQTYATPGTEKVLTSENLRALTTETPIILCPVQNTMYGQWYDGNSTTTYGTSGTLVTESNVFLWVPILSDGVATGTGYLKKRTAESDDVAYLQTSNITTFGAQGTAQVFYPITPVNGITTGNTKFDNANIVSEYAEANLVRLVCGSSEGTTWFNFNGKQYNDGKGIWTAMEVRNATDIQTPVAHTVGEPILDAADLRAGYKYLIRNISASRSGYVYVDAEATSENLKTGAISDNTFADKYIFTAEAAEGGVYLKASNGEYIPSATSGSNLNTSATPAVVTIAQKGGSYPKTTLNLMVNGNYCNVNPGKMCIWNDVNDVNGVWEIIPVDADDFLDVTIHNQLHANNSQNVDMGSYTVSLLPNQWVVSRINLEYMTEDDAVQIDNATTEVTFTSEEEVLPFEASVSFSDAKWYLIDMHSNDTGAADVLSGAKNYIWTATTDASAYTTAEVTLHKYDTKQSAAFGDNMLWCFVGNVFDGFVIYNKAAGSEYALAKPETGNTAAKLAAFSEATPFRIYQSTQVTGATCFKKQGDNYYVNTQAVSDVKVLRGWTASDGGSSCRFFAPDHYLLNYAADITAGPANSLGTAKYFNTEGKFESFNSAIAAANADHFNAEATANLATILTDYASDAANATPNDPTITDGYYRLMNYHYKTYMTSGLSVTNDDALWGGLSAAEAPGTAGTIVKITADGDKYKMSTQGLKFGAVSTSAHVNLTGEGLFTSTATNNKYVFEDVSSSGGYRCLHCDASNKIVGWEAVADASKWYLIPAKTLNQPLNAVEGKSYATTYLPFDVTLPANVKAYIVTVAEGGKATVSEVAAIPANQGVVLVSETAASTATLTLGEASPEALLDYTDNKLSGTNPRITIAESEKNNYYIFGNGGNGVGFYHPNSYTLKENRAYLYLPVSEGSGVNGFKLDFGGINTGIEAVIQADEANATYYDLSGRRVIRPAKGIYVKNGRKVYVK